jgi:hypothetical protein
MFEIRIDKQALTQFERQIKGIPNALPRVMSRGLNRTATQARTKVKKLLASETGLKSGQILKRLTLLKASYTVWRSGVVVKRSRLSLSLLNPKPAARGGLSVKAGRKRVLIRRAFTVGKLWFIRLPQAGGYKGTIGVTEAQEIDGRTLVARKPIAAIKGPILSKIYVEAEAEAARIYAESVRQAAKNIKDQVDLLLERKRAG